MSVVKINVLTVPPQMRSTLEERFAGRAGAVESSDGFEWFELLRPVEGTDDYLVYTRWRSDADFEAWTASQAFGQGHQQAGGGQAAGGHAGEGERRPEGEGRAASGATLWSFEVVQSAGPAAS